MNSRLLGAELTETGAPPPPGGGLCSPPEGFLAAISISVHLQEAFLCRPDHSQDCSAEACIVTCLPGAILSPPRVPKKKKKKESTGAGVPLLEHKPCIVQPSSDSAKPGGPLGRPLFSPAIIKIFL